MTLADQERIRLAADKLRRAVDVAIDLDAGESPKQLRVDLLRLRLEFDTLLRLVIARTSITRDDYEAALALALESELERYREKLRTLTGADLNLD